MASYDNLELLERYNRDENNVTAKVFAGLLCNEFLPGNTSLGFLRTFLDGAGISCREADVSAKDIEVTFFPQADHFGLPIVHDPERSKRLDSGEISDVVIRYAETLVAIECKFVTRTDSKVARELIRQYRYLEELQRQAPGRFRQVRQVLVHVPVEGTTFCLAERLKELKAPPELVVRMRTWEDVRSSLPQPYRALRLWGKCHLETIPRLQGTSPPELEDIEHRMQTETLRCLTGRESI